ncbi:helix-turn-helix domain-containing protein [Knoellia koreensis]|uniref:Helix-turn-helix transcriptional regulator n=1 Tax=Knoellia koreensis TaxID=2730921 RepID=A0A849HPX4_9MICO|nr:helix-turn-helix transcriptional regulator [Knoellia sp. DB2414S]NNM46647.1 helix-turn-helix transcriptional regulator [Knoellia sp. DB2414S]
MERSTVVRLTRPSRAPRRPEPLWREAVGWRLRRLRQRRGDTIVEVAVRAGISPQYLSELERGRKDPSSEVLAAVAGALDVTVVEVTTLAATDLRRHPGVVTGSVSRPTVMLAA